MYRNEVVLGDCVEVMAAMEPESIDAIVCDPPYGLEFMGKEWDSFAGRHNGGSRGGSGDKGVLPGYGRGGTSEDRERFRRRSSLAAQAWHEAWAREAFRVLKPGGHLLAFGGTRTSHRLACAIEDAGFEIRDTLMWGYATGFPKSRNLDGDRKGWGTALKPAWEPIVMARKPLRGTVAANVQRYGPGALNIDGCRIPLSAGEGLDDRDGEPTRDARYTDEGSTNIAAKPGKRIRVGGGGKASSGFVDGYERGDGFVENTKGRWPANVVLTDPVLDGGWEGVEGGGNGGGWFAEDTTSAGRATETGFQPGDGSRRIGYSDSGTYSRFFLIPKPGRKERGAENTHPTVKPVALMRHLVRLVTPPGGLVLDPFLGSGTTALAARAEGFDWIGIERDPDYARIAESRIMAKDGISPLRMPEQESLWEGVDGA